jgi:hypothetical protein
LAAPSADGLGELDGLAGGDPVGVGVLKEAEDVVDADGEPCAAVSTGDPHAISSRARTDTIGCPFLTVASSNAGELVRLFPAAEKGRAVVKVQRQTGPHPPVSQGRGR